MVYFLERLGDQVITEFPDGVYQSDRSPAFEWFRSRPGLGIITICMSL